MDLTGVGADDDDGGRLVAVAGCPCGAVHQLSSDARDAYLDVVAGLPAVIPIRVDGVGAWRVPRLYVAMHGLKAAELAGLAEQYGWPAV
jgi:hypothetical protein